MLLLGGDEELDRTVQISDRGLHLLLCLLVQLLRLIERLLWVARGRRHDMVKPHFLKALLAHRSAEQLLRGVPSRSVR